MESKQTVIIGVIKMRSINFSSAFVFFLSLYSLFTVQYSFSQNSKIKCYFNHPVNTAVSTGTNAIYLNGTFKDTLVNYINRAKYSIDLCVYNYYSTSGSDQINAIATAINNAYTRGVAIRWIGNGTSSNSGWALLNTNINTVSSPTTTGYGICHNKFVVFDANSTNANDPTVWTGSYNFSTEQNSTDYNNVLIVQDKNVALAYYNEFNKMWGSTTTTPGATKFGVNKTASAVTSFTVNGTPIEVYFSPKDAATSHLGNAINSSNYEMFFGIYTFTDNSTVALDIKARISAGVTAYGIMDVFSQTYQPYTTLSPSGVMGTNLKVYNGGSSSLYHNKVMVVDALHPASNPQVCTGSFNWTASANTSNDENFIIVHDSIIANQYYQSLCKNFTDVGGSATACPATSGIEAYDYGQQQFAVFPNPSEEILHIKVKNAGEKLIVRIVDNLGNIVRETAVVNNDEVSINVQNLSAGLYFVSILRGDKAFTQKFLKN